MPMPAGCWKNVEAMAELSAVGDTQWLNIAFNPSSWIADCFVRFYQIHEKENLHCQVHTGKNAGSVGADP